MDELKPIPSFPGYFATRDGRIFGRRGQMSPVLTPKGYLRLNLRRDGRYWGRHVHVLVAEAFHGLRPEGLQVRHLDGVKTNNAARNLRYGTPAENAQDAVRHGDNPWLNKTHCPRLHPYDGPNTYRSSSGSRKCRRCAAEYQARRRNG
jgi:hypothetical protein